MKNITLVLPSSGINFLWQIGALQALCELGLHKNVVKVYGSSGGAWASIFFGLGKEVLNQWVEEAPAYFAQWQKENRFTYVRRSTTALHEDSKELLKKYGFF